MAVSLIETALLDEYDVGIIFSSDTDLLPAVEVAFRRTAPRIEIAAWSGAKPLWFPDDRAAKVYLPWCHFLNRADYEMTRDRTRYLRA